VDVTINLIEGVVSSFVAVALIELYLAIRNRIRDRPLRSLLHFADRITVITPEYPKEVGDRVGSLMATHDSIALAHLLEVCTRVNASSVLVSASRLPEDLPSVAISIGGPVSNPITAFYLRKYCGNLQPIATEGYTEGFEIPGAERFREDADTTWAFIARLDASMTGRSGVVILTWGATAHATATAAFYLANNAPMLPWRNKNFFVALAVDRKLGYRSVQRKPVDISALMFPDADTSADLPFSGRRRARR
jgi:hypothetical protein